MERRIALVVGVAVVVVVGLLAVRAGLALAWRSAAAGQPGLLEILLVLGAVLAGVGVLVALSQRARRRREQGQERR
ncbi:MULTISPECIES: hypothetical protein [Actinosynnema]|uniref:hypothetical protein n=1 Tax=Actinosynnema TaxID=40566 RepID=UPI0020A3E5AE|nr:hypothetical protein [Actinosynnema pretiosum]MCP2094830.1 hypothetical protein [Actinosynnema pretiosum]